MYDPAGPPVRSPIGSPVRSPIGSPVRSPIGSPVRPPIGSSVGSPVCASASSPPPSRAGEEEEEAAAGERWPEGERRQAMFSAFKAARAVNPADWDGRLRFWRERVTAEARDSGDATLSLARLQGRYARPRPPLGLATVLREMMREGSLVRESELAGGWGSGWLWGAGRLALAPARWARDALLGDRSNAVAPDERLVLPAVVEDAASAVLAWRAGRPHAAAVAVRLSAVLDAVVWPHDATLRLALRVLQQRRQLTTLTIAGVEVVKFAAPGAAQAPPLSPVDVGVVKLETAQGLLAERAHAQGHKAHALKEEARAHVRKGNKRQALRCLRECKRVEQQLERVKQQQDSLEHLLESVHAAHTDAMVVQAFQAGKAALHKVLQSGPDTDAVEALMDEIQELKEEQEDVSRAISQDISGTDDAELEEELSALLEESAPPSPLPRLPEVPPTLSQLSPGPHDDAELEEELSALLEESALPSPLPRLPEVPPTLSQLSPGPHDRSAKLSPSAELEAEMSRLQIHGDPARNRDNANGQQASDHRTTATDAL